MKKTLQKIAKELNDKIQFGNVEIAERMLLWKYEEKHGLQYQMYDIAVQTKKIIEQEGNYITTSLVYHTQTVKNCIIMYIAPPDQQPDTAFFSEEVAADMQIKKETPPAIQKMNEIATLVAKWIDANKDQASPDELEIFETLYSRINEARDEIYNLYK